MVLLECEAFEDRPEELAGDEVREVVLGQYSQGLKDNAWEFRCYPAASGESFWNYRRRETLLVMILV